MSHQTGVVPPIEGKIVELRGVLLFQAEDNIKLRKNEEHMLLTPKCLDWIGDRSLHIKMVKSDYKHQNVFIQLLLNGEEVIGDLVGYNVPGAAWRKKKSGPELESLHDLHRVG